MSNDKPYRLRARVKDVQPREPARAHRGTSSAPELRRPKPGKKPYAFAALPAVFRTDPPVWHDGSSSEGKVSGELRCELTTLSPMLVGWERQSAESARKTADPCAIAASRITGDRGDRDLVKLTLEGLPSPVEVSAKKSVLCPLRAPWGERPVLIPGDSLKGMLRHELGALLGAPMERVAERSYSYRPNLAFPDKHIPAKLEPRLARVLSCSEINLDGVVLRVPHEVELYALATRHQQHYFPRYNKETRTRETGPDDARPYRGGMGGGVALPEVLLPEDGPRPTIHTHIDVDALSVEGSIKITSDVVDQYRRTLQHLLAEESGHFSSRHPRVHQDRNKFELAERAIRDAAQAAFAVGDMIWVELCMKPREIVSFGWHYYYRWAYQDTVRRAGGSPREGLHPVAAERSSTAAIEDEKSAHTPPEALTAVRRLFGYTGDNDGSKEIGRGNHSQLMGRISINAAIEVVEGDLAARFEPPTFLKELGLPKPSAVEHYLLQPHANFDNPDDSGARDSDRAYLLTYGDAQGHDQPGTLAGRKFYLDRPSTGAEKPWEDKSPENQRNERSTLAVEASRPGRRFRFTVRFRDLEERELVAVLVALCPDQLAPRENAAKAKAEYCSKLGYARPLGWGSVRICAKELHLLALPSPAKGGRPTLDQVPDLATWLGARLESLDRAALTDWLALHQRKHQDAGDYPQNGGKVYDYHTLLRKKHSQLRRQKGSRS